MISRLRSRKFAAILGALALGGCITTSLPYMRAETAQRLAAPAWMAKRDIPAGAFLLRSYERMHERHKPANIYIGGHGLEASHQAEFAKNPTPRNPLALHLATKDSADNVAYIAQPCQFTGMADGSDCTDTNIWQDARYSEDKLASMNTALDDIARRYDITGFHLIGYDGGAAVAALLSAQRKDVLSLRTVAGVLDARAHTALRGKEPLKASANPADFAQDLMNTPQFHFIGAQDNFVPPAIFHSYMQSMPPNPCVQSMLVQEAGHEDGWVNKWPELLKLPVTCYNGNAPEGFAAIDTPNAPVFIVEPSKPEKP